MCLFHAHFAQTKLRRARPQLGDAGALQAVDYKRRVPPGPSRWSTRSTIPRPKSFNASPGLPIFLLPKKTRISLCGVGGVNGRSRTRPSTPSKIGGYHFEHNFGLGKEHQSEVFVMLMMLAFLVDQTQQLCSPLFLSALEKAGSKRALWGAAQPVSQL